MWDAHGGPYDMVLHPNANLYTSMYTDLYSYGTPWRSLTDIGPGLHVNIHSCIKGDHGELTVYVRNVKPHHALCKMSAYIITYIQCTLDTV